MVRRRLPLVEPVTPKTRGDCSPREHACPWCHAKVVMRLRHDDPPVAVTVHAEAMWQVFPSGIAQFNGSAALAITPMVPLPEPVEPEPYLACPACEGRVAYSKGGTFTKYDPSKPAPKATREYLSELNHCRPCSRVSCRHHLFLEVNEDTGSIRINQDQELWEMPETCALDVAEKRHGITLEEIGKLLGLTRERIRQVEVRGLIRLRHRKLNGEE